MIRFRAAIAATALGLVLGGAATARGAAALRGASTRVEASRADGPVRIVVLHTNDIHGQFLPREARGRKGEKVGGLAALDTALARERAKAKETGAHVLLVDSGDWYQGTPEGNFAKDGIPGALAVDWMSHARYDAAVLGNHEFDFGVANVKALMARAKFPVLGANVLEPVAAGPAAPPAAARAPMAKPYVVLERGGVKVAFVGLLTDDTPRMVAEGRLGDVTISSQYDAGRKWFDLAKKEADLVMFVTHCGKGEDEKLARRVPETPVIFGGHSHTFIAQPNFVEHERAALATDPWKPNIPARTYVTQTGSKAENLDRVELWIDPADKKIEKIEAKVTELLHAEFAEDPETVKWITKETEGVTRELDGVVATLAAPAEPAAAGSRTDPTANFMTDGMLWSAKKFDPQVVAAFGNRGGVRTKIATGPLTRRTIYEIAPFDNTIVLLSLTGSDLWELAAEGLQGSGDASLLSAGLVGAGKRKADGSMDWSGLTIGGKAIEANAKYRVAANSFIAEGKGGLTKFKLGTDKRDTGQLVRDAMIEYAAAKKTIALDDVLRLKAEKGARVAEPAGAGK